MIRPGKFEVVEYVRQRLPEITVETVMFNPCYQEWPGSVYSAKKVFSENNLVLLPDSYLSLIPPAKGETLAVTYPSGKTLAEAVVDALYQYKVVFGCIACKDWQRLKTLGAVRMEKGIVTAFQDKPLPGEMLKESYNGFWGCYAFAKEYGKSLYDFLIPSLHHHPLRLTEQHFYPPGVIPVVDYYDLGTWENIKRFKKEREMIFSKST